MKFLISILTSYNEYILLETYYSIKQQIEHTLDYTIIIVVNSLNTNYINDVKELFKYKNVEIIETLSNGKPGKGHNSVIQLFKNRTSYDYLIPIDGDDFLYPQALHQISKVLNHNPTIIVGGNEDFISNFKEIYNKDTCYSIDYSYFLYTEPNIFVNKSFSLYNKGTPCRLILLHKSIFDYNIDTYYCESCKVFDDYLFYLNILHLYYTTNINIYYISLKNIYLYYKAHISSVCYQNSHNCPDNLSLMIDKFKILKDLDKQNICLKLPILYISNYLSDTLVHKNYKNNINYELKDFNQSFEFSLNYKFNYQLVQKIYDSTLLYIYKNIHKLESIDISIKKKIYLTLENFILNNHFNNNIFKLFLHISNHLHFIACDLIPIIHKNYFYFNKLSYIDEFNNKNYVSSYIIIKYLLMNNLKNDANIYYYYNICCIKLNIENIHYIDTNSIQLHNKKTVILLDYMDIDYNPNTPYIKSLGGTQQCYIYLALELSQKYNVIILNKSNKFDVIYQNNIYVIKYTNNELMIQYINNIIPDILIYNFINISELLKKNIKNSIKLFMYEHLCIYSNFDIKKNSDYSNYYDKIIFVSYNQYITYNKYHSINNHIILNNGLSPIFYNNDYKFKLIEKELSIIYISNPQRGLECFIYIFPLLKKKYPSLKLYIYSSLDMYNIEDNSNLIELYNKLSEIEGIYYNKSISQYELIQKLNSCLLFIYPTFVVESFCNSMIEAMSCGCYVISTNIGALKSVAHPYGDFIDVNITNTEDHPYYDSIDSNYIDNIVEKSSNIIDKYLNNSIILEIELKNQIHFIKNKYNWNKQNKYLSIFF